MEISNTSSYENTPNSMPTPESSEKEMPASEPELTENDTTEIRNKAIYREISELKAPMEDLLDQLQENINKGTYGLVIGDDASGRIPTLILSRIIKKAHKKNGFPPPLVRFIAGSRYLAYYEMGEKEKIEQIKNYLRSGAAGRLGQDQKALVVTDTVVTGVSLLPLARALSEIPIQFDIAAVGMPLTTPYDSNDQDDRCAKEKQVATLKAMLGGSVITSEWNETPNIYGKPYLSGVEKTSEALHAHKLKNADMRDISGARKQSAHLADELFHLYFEKGNTK